MSTKVGPKLIATSTVKTAATQDTQTTQQAWAADLALLQSVKDLVGAQPQTTANARETSTFTPAAAQKTANPQLSMVDNAIDQAFKRVYVNDSRPTSGAEFEKYRKAAQERADKGMSPKDIMHDIANMIRADKAGGTSTPGGANPNVNVDSAIDQAFKRVYMNDSRPTTGAELEKYRKAAQERADKGMSQKDIMHDIANMIRADKAGGTTSPGGGTNPNVNVDSAIDQAFKRVYLNDSRPTTGAELEKYRKAAQERADKGMSQKDIMHDIANMIRADKAGGTTSPGGGTNPNVNVDSAIDQAFKRVYLNDSRPTTGAELEKYRKAAQERADKGMSQKDIMHDIANMIRADKAGGTTSPGGGTNPNVNVDSAIDQAFKRVYLNDSRPTTGAELEKYRKAAQERADKGMSQKDIMHDIANMIRADKATGGGGSNSTVNVDSAIDQAFKRVYMNDSRPTTGAELEKYRKAAQERADKGMSQKDIMHDIANMIRADRQ
ncbi:hypothetical protein [Pyxidicoccus trucidator]|uniref:hypothetical protein n=1 Tax=Pyxidicoccus trucidator TaxID=2709662 RepID=UPI0013DD82E6|nr:hypothetical protein [Pyxidicoccus trucidator]